MIDRQKLQLALQEQMRWERPLAHILVDMHLVAEDVLVRTLASALRMDTVSLDQVMPPPDAMRLVPLEIAQRHGVLPIRCESQVLELAMSDPTDGVAIADVQRHARMEVQPVVAGPRSIEKAMGRWYPTTRMPAAGVIFEMSSSGGMAPQSGFEPPTFDPRVEIPASTFPSRMQAPTPPQRTLTPSPRTLGLPQPTLTPLPRTSTPPRAPAPAPTEGLELALALQRLEETERHARDLETRLAAVEKIAQSDRAAITRLCRLIVDKGLATREEILDYLNARQ